MWGSFCASDACLFVAERMAERVLRDFIQRGDYEAIGDFLDDETNVNERDKVLVCVLCLMASLCV